MPKRKLTQDPSAELSDILPPPAGLLGDTKIVDGAAAAPNGVNNSVASKKRKTKDSKQEVVESDTNINDVKQQKPARATRKRRVKYEEESGSQDSQQVTTARGKKREVKVKKEEAVRDEPEDGTTQKKVKRKRKTKEEKEAEAMPLAARTVGHKLFIGAHVSSAGGTISDNDSIRRSRMLKLLHRRPQLRYKHRPHRSQRFRPLPQVTAQVGEPSLGRRCLCIFPRQLLVAHIRPG